RGVRAGVPDLLPVDDPLVAVEDGAGLQTRQVRSRVGLGVGDGEVDLALQDGRQPARLLLLAADAQDGGRDRAHREPHGRRARRTCTTSILPVSPISTLITKVKNDIRSQPPSADQKPCTVKPFTTSDAIQSMLAFTTSVKRPSVKMLSGSVRRRMSGRTTALS